jgi:hypothetical protein
MTVRRRTTEGSSEVATAEASTETPPTSAQAHDGSEEVRKKKKKKKFSRGMGGGQRAEVSLTRGAHRLAVAVEDALSTWRNERNRSSRNKRDGAIRDAVKNYGKALSKFGRHAAKIPEDLTESMPKLTRLFR